MNTIHLYHPALFLYKWRVQLFSKMLKVCLQFSRIDYCRSAFVRHVRGGAGVI